MPDTPRRASRSALAPRLAEDLIATLPALLDEVAEYFGTERPEMAQFLKATKDEVEAGTTIALERLAVLTVRVLDGGTLVAGPDQDVEHVLFAEIGRAHWRRGED